MFKSKFFLFLLVVGLFGAGVSIARELRSSYEVSMQIRQLQSQIQELENHNTELAGLLTYLESPEYQEQEARQKLNLQKPGEHVVILPEVEVPAKKIPTNPTLEVELKSNWKNWWNYFFSNS